MPSLNLDETAGFYQRLGFHLEARYEGDYAILRRENCEIHFFLKGDLDPTRSFFGCYWRVRDAEALYAEFAALQLPSLHPVEEKPWGMLEFALIDPHGNLIRVGQEID